MQRLHIPTLKQKIYHPLQNKLIFYVAAVGRANFITKEHVKPGAVVIDVGINRDENNKLVGDVDFDEVEPIASHITPVPGGVGPMTITMLLYNTVQSAEKTLGDK